MRSIPQCVLNAPDISDLAGRQAEISSIVSFQGRVELAKTRFDGKPKALFGRVRTALASALGELVRCGYCEDSCADEVEHVWPKNYFPGRTFDPTNYLFVCGICNPAKNDKFCVLHNGVWVDLPAQRKASGFLSPPSFESRFIDPLTEMPQEFLWLDIVENTLMFVPQHDPGTLEYDRAKFTIDTLRLNREVLVEMRKDAYAGFRDRIHRYVECKQSGDEEAALSRRLSDLRRTPHQTVRMEMGRQLAIIDPPHPDIAIAPEVFV